MKTRIYVVMAVVSCLVAISVYAEKDATKAPAPLNTEMEKVSYAIGTQIGQNFKRQAIEINLDMMMRGLQDALAGKEPVLTQDQIKEVLTAFQQRMRTEQQERQKKEGAENLIKGKAFLDANKAKEGVKVLPSGLQYKVITKGTGKTPKTTDKVKTHYAGTLIDGTEFDSSYKRGTPAEFPVTGVIKGWTEALQLMKEGGKWELYIPAALAYGEQGRPSIPPNSVLVFQIELIEVLAKQP